jgi:ribonuclease J
MVRLAPPPATIIDDVPIGRLYRDGAIITRADDGQVRDRRKLSFAGAVSVSVVLSEKGALLADPEVALTGIPATDANGTPFETIAREAAIGTIESIPRPRRKDDALVAEAVRRGVRAAINQAWGKKPVCSVLLTVV